LILFNDGRFKKELGILPLKLFWLRSRISSLGRWPRESGIEPFKLFRPRFRVVKFDRFPNSCGIPPVMPDSLSGNTRDRAVCRLLIAWMPL